MLIVVDYNSNKAKEAREDCVVAIWGLIIFFWLFIQYWFFPYGGEGV